MKINNKEFKVYDKNPKYFISKDGDVYSSYSKKILKKLIRKVSHNKQYYYVDIWVDGKQRHMNIHRLVWYVWVESISMEEQINHINDNSFDNRLENLYKGTQKENIADCFRNENRVGAIKYLKVFDKKANKEISFVPANKFIEYCGHSSKSGSVKKFFNKLWFKKQYTILEYRNIIDLNDLKSGTTMADECKPVE